MLVDQKKLDLYVQMGFNVLFEGERGVGKTSVIYDVFKRAGLRVKYFSAPTMDPWTDLVGVPTTVTRSDGKEVLRIISPEEFADDKYDVIFIDELNRAPKKVMNALLELIQMKTINGKPYSIKMIWAAINPFDPEKKDDPDYHVEPLDKALEDRFEIKIKFPYKVDVEFFRKAHGATGEIFCQWWNNQPAEVQKEISPRRLFGAAGFHLNGGDFTDMINIGNTAKLKEDLRSVSQIQLLEKDFANKSIVASKTILNKNYSANVEKYLQSSKTVFEFFFPHLDKEWLAKEFYKEAKVFKYMLDIAKDEKSANSAQATELIGDIVNVKSGSNNFVKKNMALLGSFLSNEQQENLSKAPAAKELWTTTQQEANLVNAIGDKPLLNNHKIRATDLLKQYSWTKVADICKTAHDYVKKGVLPAERVKEQMAQRIGAVLAYAHAQGLSESGKKVMDALTDPTHKSYIWNKSNIDSLFKDMGEDINQVMDEYQSMSAEDIKSSYLEKISKKTNTKHHKVR